jgi:hypothetical protein
MAVNVAVLANNLLKALIRESLVFPCQKLCGGYCVVITYQAAKNIVLNVLVLLLSVSFWQIVKAHADSPQSNGV